MSVFDGTPEGLQSTTQAIKADNAETGPAATEQSNPGPIAEAVFDSGGEGGARARTQPAQTRRNPGLQIPYCKLVCNTLV